MRILLDTNVVSELRRQRPDERVVTRVRQIDAADAFLSVIALGELVYGVQRLPKSRKRRDLAAWLDELERSYGERILPIDAETARLWGEVTAASESKGRPLPPQDGLIAATALRHGLHLMTRNVRNFAHTGVRLINPWGA